MLERLAGKETTDNLNIAQYSLKTQNVDLNDINFKKKQIPVNIEAQNAVKKNN